MNTPLNSSLYRRIITKLTFETDYYYIEDLCTNCNVYLHPNSMICNPKWLLQKKKTVAVRILEDFKRLE